MSLVTEHSSGAKVRRGAITKAGNAHVRRADPKDECKAEPHATILTGTARPPETIGARNNSPETAIELGYQPFAAIDDRPSPAENGRLLTAPAAARLSGSPVFERPRS